MVAPSQIGKPESLILLSGDGEGFSIAEPLLRVLAPQIDYLGTDPVTTLDFVVTWTSSFPTGGFMRKNSNFRTKFAIANKSENLNACLHCYNRWVNKKTQLLLTVILLGVVDAIVPFLPILALILIYVVLEKPPWFLETVQEIYKGG